MRPKKYRRARNVTEHRMVSALDKLAAFEEFEAEILPALKKDLRAGLSAQQIVEKYQALLAAKQITTAFSPMSPPAVSAAATKDMLDRGLGKPTEKKELTHRLDQLPEQELDALLASKMKDVILDGDDE